MRSICSFDIISASRTIVIAARIVVFTKKVKIHLQKRKKLLVLGIAKMQFVILDTNSAMLRRYLYYAALFRLINLFKSCRNGFIIG